MKLHRFGPLGVLVAAVLCAAAPAVAAPVTVNLRIEGSNATVFEGPVTTDAKMITTAAGGTHECDGTQNGNATGATPGATPTTALDDAAAAHGFTWDGRYGNFGIDDFLVERIGSDGTAGTFDPVNFWDLLVNRIPASLGGCQFRVSQGDTVLFEWQDGNTPNLELTAPASAQVGQAVDVTVQQYAGMGGTLSPASGASVGGQVTDASGHATLTFPSPGTQHLKATQPGAIRSNAVDICVYTPGSGDCGSPTQQVQGSLKDTLPPSIAIGGIRNGARFRRGHGPRKLAGTASDASGLFQVYFRLERRSGGGCQWYSSKRSVFTRASRGCAHARFQHVGTNGTWSYLLPSRLAPGRYRLEEKAIDRVFNTARQGVTFTVLG